MVIYADNAATTQLDIDAFEAMKPFLLDNYANPSGAYSFSKGAKQAIKAARSTIAECINAEPEQIYFTSGGILRLFNRRVNSHRILCNTFILILRIITIY